MNKKRILIVVLSSVVALSLIAGGLFFFLSRDTDDWGEWTVTTEATCEAPGVQQRTNSEGEVETQEIPALGHDYDINVKNPSCTKDGFSLYDCARCESAYISDFKIAHGHAYGEWETKKLVTCSSSGFDEQSCLLCGEKNRNVSQATGHSYAPISTETIDSMIYVTYQCQTCEKSMVLEEGESITEAVGTDVLFDIDPSFTFKIKTDKDEEYIRNHLKILDAYFNNTEYEDAEEVIVAYTLRKLDSAQTYSASGICVWEVSPSSEYEFDTTYIAKITGALEFDGYSGEELTYTVKADENHENRAEFQDNIIFLQALENASPGYYPYVLSAPENSAQLYLTLGKVDGLAVGQIICVGNVVSANEITADTECDFGKIDGIYPLASGEWMVILCEPELSEIFSVLDISYEDIVDLESGNIDVEQVETELVKALYENEDFIKFLCSVNVTSKEYASAHDLDISSIASIMDFMKKIQIKPSIRFENKKLIGTITGNLTIPLKNANKKVIGSIVASFEFSIKSEFRIDVNYKLKHGFLGIPYGIKYFDIGLTQTDDIEFKFDINIDIDYSLEEGKYLQNTESGKIHRKGCVHIARITDSSKLKNLSVKEAEKMIGANPTLECKQCQPTKEFNYDLLILHKKDKVIHAYNCMYVKQISASNREVSQEKSANLILQGYTCCDWCHPDDREERNYKEIAVDSLKYSDWQQVAVDISQWAKSSGFDESVRSEKYLAGISFDIFWPVSASIDVYFVLDFNLEASVTYEYQYTQTNRYGMRVDGSGVHPYHTKTEKTLKNELTLLGKCEVKVGLMVDANVHIWGLKKWIRAGVTAEVGAYAEAYGVVYLNFISESTDENYAAAYFEVGVYIDIDAYYKLFDWGGNVNIYDNKWPMLRLGYDKAYYGYVSPVEELEVNNSYDISNLLDVKYFELKTLTTKEERLNIYGVKGLYEVKISLKEGKYFSVSNGTIIEKSNAPCYFEDTLTIQVIGKTSWGQYVKGSSVFYLQEYEITLTGEGATHTYGAGTVTKEANCTQNGSKTLTCTICSATKTETLAKLGHNEISHSAKAPTCTEKGWNAYVTCSRCSYTTYVEKAALGHVKVSHAAKAPTCTEKGWNAYETCSRCNYTTYVEKAALGHVKVSHAAKAPTCTEKGWNAYETCSRCNYTTYVEKAALGHSEEVIPAIAATCIESGLSEGKKCSTCGEVFVAQEVIPALGHTEVVIPAVAATCVESGLSEGKKCSVCGEVFVAQEVIPALGHTEVVIPAVAATCIESGLSEGKKCSVCGEILASQEVIPALGHDYGEWKVTKEPTLTEAGEQQRICSVCGDVETESIPALEACVHVKEILPGKNATCVEEGVTEGVKCSACGEILVKQEVIPVVPCSGEFLESFGAVIGNCTTKEVLAGEKCSLCGHVWVAPEEKDYVHDNVVEQIVPATCTEYGIKVTLCTTCGADLDAVLLEPTGHDTYEEAVANGYVISETPASCTVDGKYEWTCHCGAAQEKVIPMTGHDLKDSEVLPTCLAKGYRATYCSTCRKDFSNITLEALGHDYVNGVCTRCGVHEAWVLEWSTFRGEELSYPTAWIQSVEDLQQYIAAHNLFEEDFQQYDAEYFKNNNLLLTSKSRTLGTSPYLYCEINLEICSIQIDWYRDQVWPVPVYATVMVQYNFIIEIPDALVQDCDVIRIGLEEFLIDHTCKHNLTYYDEQQATCTEIGWNAYEKCSLCGYTTYAEIPALGHAWSDATCTESKFCSICGETEGAPLGHSEKIILGVRPTCTEDGLTEGRQCSVCGEILVIQEKIPKAFCIYAILVEFGATEGDCYTKEVIAGEKCSACGFIWTAPVEKDFVHTDVVEQIAPATCTEYGVKATVCKTCGQGLTAELIDPTGHDNYDKAVGEGTVIHTTPASCTVDGKYTWECHCGEVQEEKIISATGHDKVTISRPATCVSYAYTFTYCQNDNCTDSNGNVVVAVSKVLVGGVEYPVYSLDEALAGQPVKVIGDVVVDTVGGFDPNEHGENLVVPKVWNEPDCTHNGSHSEYCSACGYTDDVVVDSALGHDYVNGICTRCNDGAYTDGLEYTLLPDGTYEVSVGIANDVFEIVIPSTHLGKPVTAIADSGFELCGNLRSIVIPDSITRIGTYAFKDCSILTEVRFGKGVTSIGEYAFSGCSSLTSIVLPEGVTSIEGYTFLFCLNLTSITIPESVTSIGEGVFLFSDNLTDIYFQGTEEAWNAIEKSSAELPSYANIHFNS